MSAIIACHANSYSRFGTRAAIENVRSAGLEVIEFPIRTAGVPTAFGDEPLLTDRSQTRDLRTVEKMLDDHSVRICSCNVTSGNPLDKESLEITKRKLEVAGQLGVALVVGGAGEADNPESLVTLHRHLAEIGDCAARLGMVYCFETHPGICCDHRGMLESMQALNHPNLQLNFDTGNILYYNENINGEIALSKVSPHVRHVHLKDSNGQFGRWHFPALGRGGAVDFVRVLQILKPCGFSGPYSLEIEGIAGEGELPLSAYHERVVESVSHLRSCGYFD